MEDGFPRSASSDSDDLHPWSHHRKDEAYETVGGFIMAELSRVADVGDTVALDGA